jgi:hypothetical protein
MISTQDRNRLGPRAALSGGAFILALLGLVQAGLTGCGGGHHGSGSAQTVVGVTAVVPDTGPFIGGTTITLTGRSFRIGEVNTVLVGGNPASNVVIVDESTLTCTTPPGTPGATVDVVVTNSAGQGRLANGFMYLTLPMARSDVDGDGIADLVVAAPQDDAVGGDGGAVYVFLGSSDPLSLQNRTTAQADLKIIGHHAGDRFGTSLSAGDINGDEMTDLVVGADRVDAVGAPGAGAAYVFYGPLPAAPQMSALAASVRLTGDATLPGDRFGSAVEVADVDGDGMAEVLVGASRHDTAGGIDAGCVYLFRGGASLTSKGAELADMFFDGAATQDQLGATLTCGDLNGDGHVDLVLASQLADPMVPTLQQNAGRVAILLGGAGLTSTPVSAAGVILNGVAAEDRFGASANVADVNGDGIDDLLVGAPLQDGVDVDTGRVYVFLGGAGLASGSADSAHVVLSGLPTHNSFGATIQTGDVDGDGIADILVGAPQADYLNDGNGRAYLFRGGPALSSQVAVGAAAIFNGEQVQDEALGSSINLLDLNADGFADVTCGAARHELSAGRVYLWFGSTTLGGQHLAAMSDIHYSGLETGGRFGDQLAEGQ